MSDERIDVSAPEAYINRELSWLAFARRVIALAADPELPLMERVKFAGISGMLHDEFFMKRISGLKRQVERSSTKLSLDGRTPAQELAACRTELLDQMAGIAATIEQELRPALAREGFPILAWDDLDEEARRALRRYFHDAVMPILTPLAVDSEHPFPFISNLTLNLGVMLPDDVKKRRFVRIKVPGNRPRWVAVPGGAGVVPLEQVIAANLDLMFPGSPPLASHLFRITRGAGGKVKREDDPPLRKDPLSAPGSFVEQVSNELKARRFAGVVRLQVGTDMPKAFLRWLTRQVGVGADDVYATDTLVGLSALLGYEVRGRRELYFPPHNPVTHRRLRRVAPGNPEGLFAEIRRGDILLHHPYDDFDSSVLRFIESAAGDPDVLALKLTIYRTSTGSPIVRALVDAVRRGKQVAVLVEITARFDEGQNIAWGQQLENEGVHVSYGVERLKTHVKLALVVRQEGGRVRRYAHVGTGNYHSVTARVYEDLGVLTCHPEICEDVAGMFNALTGATAHPEYARLIVAPQAMRERFNELIRREARHAEAGRPSGIVAKMNQLQDAEIIRELYKAGAAGVPITLNVRGLCCLRPGVPGLSENIRVYSVVGRYLEHSRIYRFVNGGEPEHYIGSADWMKRNLNGRVETVLPILDPKVQRQIDELLQAYEQDNCSAWDCGPDGTYVRRSPAAGEERRATQEILRRRAPAASRIAAD